MSPARRSKRPGATQGQGPASRSPNEVSQYWLVEMRRPSEPFVTGPKELLKSLKIPDIVADESYEPVEMAEGVDQHDAAMLSSIILRVRAKSKRGLTELEKHRDVLRVWLDTQIAPFS